MRPGCGQEGTRLVDGFAEVLKAWEEARPYLHLMYTEPEMHLIIALEGGAVTVDEVGQALGIPRSQAAMLLERGYRRSIVDITKQRGVYLYSHAGFAARVDHFAKFEAWDDIPGEDRGAIDRRFLDEFIAKHRPSVERKMQGLEAENTLPNDTVLLLSEVEEMISAATHIVIQPCDCRRLGQCCERPVETCIWLDDSALETLERGHGRSVNRAEAIELVRWADRKGLMHTADSEWRTRGLHAICNCCACDCYPFRAAQELGSKGVWPRSRYIAVHDRERCNLCGACVMRCHFGAFSHAGCEHESGRVAGQEVRLDPDRCWGCGLCANTCPTGAIAMEPWP